MFNFLPEEMHGRLFPYVTLAIVVLNGLLFLPLHDRLNHEQTELTQLESQNLRLAATYPGTAATPAQLTLLEDFRHRHPDQWERLAAPDRKPADSWESLLREQGPEGVQHERAELGRQLQVSAGELTVVRYAFNPVYRSPWSYFSASFLHDSWTLLIFNMLFLWLAGVVLEDAWGYGIYASFYVTACLATVGVHSLYADSTFMGASAPVAALMGALLVRFPKTKVQRGTTRWSARPKILHFKSPVYAVLPLWLLGQILWARLVDQAHPVDYGTQAGAFVIGAVLAVVPRLTTIDQYVDQAIDTKVGGWSADKHIVKAGELLEKGNLDAAIRELKEQIAENPGSAEAYEMLPGLCQRLGDNFGYLSAIEKVCQIHIDQHKLEAAWQDYEDYCAARGDRMPAATWLEICRIAEDQAGAERAASEYERLARTWTEDRCSVVALISAARLLMRLGGLERAKSLYLEAQRSPVPHQDWDENIRKGLERIAARSNPKSEAGATSGRTTKS